MNTPDVLTVEIGTGNKLSNRVILSITVTTSLQIKNGFIAICFGSCIYLKPVFSFWL